MLADRRVVRDLDWVLLGIVLVLSVLGVAFIHSAAHLMPGHHAVRQAAWILVALAGLFLMVSVDYKLLITYAPWAYGALVAALAALLVFARLIAGTKSWLRLGIMQLQPSELAKIALILVLARIFADHKDGHLSPATGALAAAVVAGPMALTVLQPDLGTAMTYLPILLGAFLLAGLRRKMVILLLAGSVLAAAAGWQFVLHDYQKRRLTTMINPGQDARGAGYQIRQSMIALGSGGLTGKGYMRGSQSQLRFLPARHTDFIFSVVGEELGFAGVLALLALYLTALYRVYRAAARSRDRPGVYVVFMAAMLLTFELLVNVLMIIGLFPVTGVPMPFLSYGGSSLLSNFLAVGLVLNVGMRRFVNA